MLNMMTRQELAGPRSIAEIAFLRHMDAEQQERFTKVRQYREYYEGEHETQLSTRMRKYLQVKADQEFSANYMPIVVDTPASRLIIEDLDAGSQSDEMMRWWKASGMDALQFDAHVAAIRDGDAYIMVDWDEETQMPRFTLQLADDGADGAHVVYSEETGRPEWATKRWAITRGDEAGRARYINVYWPDRVDKYRSHNQFMEGDWTLIGSEPWTDGLEPLGLPLFHLANRKRGYKYGQSELEQAIPMQNALNKSVIDLLAAADTSAFRILTMIGNDPSGLEISPGSFIWIPNPPSEGAISFIPGEDLRPMIEVVNDFVQRIGQVSDTPLSYFQLSGQMASEGTHKQHESRLISKCRIMSVDFGNTWEKAFKFARKLYNVFGPGGMSEDQDVELVWRDFDVRAEVEKKKERMEIIKMAVESNAALEQAAKYAGDSDKVAKELAKIDLSYMEAVRDLMPDPQPQQGPNGNQANNDRQ